MGRVRESGGLRLLAVSILALVLALPAVAAADGPRARSAVVGGTIAAPGTYPWQVALISEGSNPFFGQFCGGTLITPTQVVTAAHCTLDQGPAGIEVLAGQNTLTNVPEANFFDVASITEHPQAQWDPAVDSVPRNDLSILQLTAPVPNAQPLDPVEPSPSGDDALWAPGDLLTLLGWGETFQPVDQFLREGRVPRVADAACAAAYPGEFFAADMVCAGFLATGGVDTCGGDSGGGLAAPAVDVPSKTNPADWRLVGVTSWGEGCAEPNAPGVYARVGAADLAAFATAKPHNLTPPSLSGTAQAGQRLTCNPGTWGGSRAKFEYAFHRVGAGLAQSGPGTTFDPTDGDAGFAITCLVTARNAGGQTQAETAPSPPVGGAPAPAPPAEQALPPAAVPQPSSGGVVTAQSGADVATPRAHIVGRTCTARSCVFTVNVTDTAPSEGIADVTAELSWRARVPCRRRGRRTTCTRTRVRDLEGVRASGNLFRVRTPALRRGRRYTIRIVAMDQAGHEQNVPTPQVFTFRGRRRAR